MKSRSRRGSQDNVLEPREEGVGQLVEEEEEEQEEGRERLPVVTVEAAGEVEAQRGSRKVDNGEREGREKEKERDAKKENGDNQKEEKKTKKEKEKNGKSGKDKEEKNGGEDEGVVGVPRSALEYWVPVSVCPAALEAMVARHQGVAKVMVSMLSTIPL